MAYFDTAKFGGFSTTPRQGIVKTVFKLINLSKQRRDLANLSDDALRDIGITREQAEKEAQRSTWDAPHHWIS